MTFSNLIALYLFLGGASAGSFAVMGVIDLAVAFTHAHDVRYVRTPAVYFGRRSRTLTHRRVSAAVYSTALVMIIVGLMCLLADLGRPEAFYLLFLNPNNSLMSIGAFALTFLLVCMVVSVAESVLVLGPGWEKAALVAKVIGVVLASVVMVYTGLLLRTVIAVTVWRSAWLPVLFLFSALSCGCAVLLLSTCFCGGREWNRAWMRRASAADASFIICEVIATVLFVLTANAASPNQPLSALLAGDQAVLFWAGFVGCGIVVPLAVEVLSLMRRGAVSEGTLAFAAFLVLAGGFCLRLALVSAGVQTAV